jgi:hypothetical protein
MLDSWRDQFRRAGPLCQNLLFMYRITSPMNELPLLENPNLVPLDCIFDGVDGALTVVDQEQTLEVSPTQAQVNVCCIPQCPILPKI